MSRKVIRVMRSPKDDFDGTSVWLVEVPSVNGWTEHIHVWHDVATDRVRCVSCGGVRVAMRSNCLHCDAVKRELKASLTAREELDTTARTLGFTVQHDCGGYRLVRDGYNAYPQGGTCPTATKKECLIFLSGYRYRMLEKKKGR